MLNAIKSYMPSPLKKMLVRLRNMVIDQYATKCYSQEGEDMILRRLFEGQQYGFYVDVGAHHPRRFSNTYFFYRQGWSGINIEPNPDVIRAFKAERRRDINLQLGVSDSDAMLKYYVFDELALNTFDENIVQLRLATTKYKLVKTIDSPVERLENILKKYLPINQAIDFLSIDVEGLDLAVLQSNDWKKFRPKYVLAEALGMTLEEAMNKDVAQLMKSHGFELFAKTHNTLIFRDKKI